MKGVKEKETTMPYQGPNDQKIPDHVKALPEEARRQWVAVWNRTFEQSKKRGASDSEAEGDAFRSANGVISKRESPNFVAQVDAPATFDDEGPGVWIGEENVQSIGGDE